MKNKKKLSLDKIKIAKLNNPRTIIGGNPVGSVVNVPSIICFTFTCATTNSTKTSAIGTDI